MSVFPKKVIKLTSQIFNFLFRPKFVSLGHRICQIPTAFQNQIVVTLNRNLVMTSFEKSIRCTYHTIRFLILMKIEVRKHRSRRRQRFHVFRISRQRSFRKFPKHSRRFVRLLRDPRILVLHQTH